MKKNYIKPDFTTTEISAETLFSASTKWENAFGGDATEEDVAEVGSSVWDNIWDD